MSSCSDDPSDIGDIRNDENKRVRGKKKKKRNRSNKRWISDNINKTFGKQLQDYNPTKKYGLIVDMMVVLDELLQNVKQMPLYERQINAANAEMLAFAESTRIISLERINARVDRFFAKCLPAHIELVKNIVGKTLPANLSAFIRHYEQIASAYNIMACGADFGEVRGTGDLLAILKKAKRLKCVQVFLGHKTKTSLKEKYRPSAGEIAEVRAFIATSGIKLFVHALLSLNFCHRPSSHTIAWSSENLLYDLRLAARLGASGVVVHTGSAIGPKGLPHEVGPKGLPHGVGGLNVDSAIENMVYNLQRIAAKATVPLLIENMSGAGERVASQIDDYALFFNTLQNAVGSAKRSMVGACIDTAHAFLAGHPIHTVAGMKAFVRKLEQSIGVERIGLIHLNDAGAPFDSRRDIHAPLQRGHLFKGPTGAACMRIIATFAKKHGIPVLVETGAAPAKECGKVAAAAATEVSRTKVAAAAAVDFKPIIMKEFRHLRDVHRDDKFRSIAYGAALQHLSSSTRPIASFADVEADPEYAQLGKKSKDKIKEIIDGTYVRCRSRANLTDVIGIGPAVSADLKKRGITTVADLKKSKIKLTKMQTLGLRYYGKIKKLNVAEYKRIVAQIKRDLKGEPLVEQIVPAGAFARGAKELGDVDLIIVAKSDEIDMKKFGDWLTKDGFMERLRAVLKPLDIFTLGRDNLMAVIKGPVQIDVKVVPRPILPFYKLHFSTGKEYSREIKAHAKAQGYKLSQYGLFKGERRVKGVKTIDDVLRVLNYTKSPGVVA